jgi:HEAT repeat protein
VLLLGSGAERIYATPYPVPLGFPGGWALLVALALVATGLLGLLAERGRLRVRHAVGWSAAGTLAIAALLWWLARIPEGLVRSVVWQAQQVGFFVVPPLAVGGVVVVLRRLRRGGAAFTARDRRLTGALVFALLMYVQLYPRIDTMHLIVVLPSALVFAAGAVARLARAWGVVLAVPPRRLGRALAAGGLAMALVAAVPNYRGLLAGPSVALASPRTPIHVEAARAHDLRDLNRLFGYLEGVLGPDEPLFGFPATALVDFALRRPSLTAHDYFFPGRPDHRAEAEIVRALERVRPRWMVTLNRRLGFFVEAPAYYFILREHVRAHYQRVARFGRYDVLRLRAGGDASPPAAAEADGPSPAVAVEALFAELADSDRDRRRAATRAFLARAEDAAGVVRLAEAWAPDDARRLLLMRNLGESGDARGIPWLAGVFDAGTARVRTEAAGALSLLAIRGRAERYLFAHPARDDARSELDVPPALASRLTGWLVERRARRQIGFFAARALGTLGDRAAEPALATLLREDTRTGVRVAAAEALVRLGQLDALAELTGVLGRQRHEVQDLVPSFLIEAAHRHPDAVGRELARMLGEGNALARETSAWIAGAARTAEAAPALRRALDADVPAVRIAAAWALGRLGDAAARPALARLAGDDAGPLGAFAREALGRVEERTS